MVNRLIEIVLYILLVAIPTIGTAAEPPANFFYHLPTVLKVTSEVWPDIPFPSLIGGQVEQETCISLTNKRCWSRFAALETTREYGFGLGQLTVTKRFNAFEEVKALDPVLKNWKWEDRFDAENQLRSILLMDLRNYNIFRSAAIEKERIAFAIAAYNGGVGGILADQRICASTRGCDSSKWFGHVQNTSLKKRTKVTGYGKSFFEINREYVENILNKRRFKYIPYLGEDL